MPTKNARRSCPLLFTMLLLTLPCLAVAAEPAAQPETAAVAAPSTVVTTETVPATPASPAVTVTTTKPVAAQMPERFMLRMGGYHARDANSVLRLDSNNVAVGTSIDFDKSLGGETETTVARIDGRFRFNDAHAIGLSWYALKFEGRRVIDRDIVFGDQTYQAYAQLDSEIEFDIYKLNYQYSLFHNEKAELGASFGFPVMQASVSLAGTSKLGFAQAGSESVTAPLPVWGLFAEYNFTPRFKTFYEYQVFNVNYDDKVKGGLQDFLFGIEYRIFRNVALGAAYNRFTANLEVEQDASTLTFDTNWNGGMLYGSLYF